MKIPVTRNLSADVNDLIGYIDIPEEMATSLAELIAGGFRLSLAGSVEVGDGKAALRFVSIVPEPSVVEVDHSNCSQCGKPAEELGGFFECSDCHLKWQR